MTDAFNFIFYIYSKFINFIFNQATIQAGVSLGWIFITIFIFGILIKNILALPKGISIKNRSSLKDKDISKGGDNNV